MSSRRITPRQHATVAAIEARLGIPFEGRSCEKAKMFIAAHVKAMKASDEADYKVPTVKQFITIDELERKGAGYYTGKSREDATKFINLAIMKLSEMRRDTGEFSEIDDYNMIV